VFEDLLNCEELLSRFVLEAFGISIASLVIMIEGEQKDEY